MPEPNAAPRRIFAAALATETNTFSPIVVDRRAFEASLYAPPGEHPDTPTLCTAPITVGRRVCTEKNWVFVEGTSAWADPAGLVSRSTYEGLRDEILGQLEAALPVDAVVLGLHGAMVAQGYIDPEGDFLTRIREIVGPDVIVCASLDPHSHLTAKRVAAADYFTAFKEFPHTDFVDRAEDLWRITVATLEGRVKPVMAVFDCHMIDVFPTSRDPMRSFVDQLYHIEADDKRVLSLSVIHGFMAGDVPELGTKIIAVTDGDRQLADTLAAELGVQLYKNRGKHLMPVLNEKQAVANAIAADTGPVVIADIWDNPGGGTAGDATVILKELISQGARDVAVGTIWDPVAVQICMAAGEGAILNLRFGGKSAPETGEPADSLVRVITLQRDAEMRFGESMVPFGDAARIALLDRNRQEIGIQVILNTVRAQSFDPTLFNALGLDPTIQKVLAIKSTNHFYASFAPIASEIIYCSAGRPYPNDPVTNPYTMVRRDIWPITDNPPGMAGFLKE